MSTGNLDLSNGRFGALTARAFVGNRPHGVVAEEPHWRCECECGQSAIVPSKELISGQRNSCGCSKEQDSIFH